ncbi:MAG: c-type cytochrome biogenesis protein CcsB [Pseudomonadota bacterium]
MSSSQEALLKEFEQPSLWQRLTWVDWIWAVGVTLSTVFIWMQYAAVMDGYERGILIGTAISLCFFGWYWKPMQMYHVCVALLSLFAIYLYGDDLAAGEQKFFLKYFFASQSAVMWMSALFVLATASFFLGLVIKSDFSAKTGSAMTWCAAAMGYIGLLVRWRESYLIHVDVGHIPVSNLYEVFILFCVMVALMYLYYEQRYKTRQMGAFVLLIISAAVAFILWYTFDRGAHEIQPLVPALQSYWMKIHVPANFVGYGAFAIAAMVGVIYLLRGTFVRRGHQSIADRFPETDQLDDVMYKSIALGFAFFTIATVLGAMWAAEAWGGYWSWDPKETWALIVWLNYAAWLHMRLTQGWRGAPMAWWSIVGLFVTLFAFLGVNMFLSGLHSYGEL